MRQDKTWECKKGEKGQYFEIEFEYQGCGIIEPLQTKGWAIRRSCECERAAQALKAQKDKEEERRKWIADQIETTYKWLGSCWSNVTLAQRTFATYQQERQPAAYKIVRAFAQYPGGILMLHGSYGTGKTHLLAALCNELRNRKEKPLSSRFATSLDLFNAIQACIARHEPYEGIIEKAVRTPLLVIDDLDKAKHSDFREEIYMSIIDKRSQLERPTAFSTNRLSELANFVGGAVASRLTIGLIEIEMVGQDFRKEL